MTTPLRLAERRAPVAQAPRPAGPVPFDLTGGFFALSLVAFGVGSALLPLIAPGLAAGDLFAPHTIATVHLFSLGVLGSAVYGALYQFYPMALGVPVRSVRLGRTGLALWALGLASLIGGMWNWSPALMATGWIAILLALGTVSYNLLPARRRTTVPDGKRIGGYVTAGHSAFGLAMAIGLARIGETAGWWTVDRLSLLAAHFHLGVLGFGTLTLLGVGSRMIPMFLLTGPTPNGPLRIVGPAIVAGLVIQATGLLAGWPLVTMFGGAILIGGALMTALLLVRWWSGRHRPLAGGLELLPAATLGLLLATGLGTALLIEGGRSFHLWAAYALAGLLGWLILVVLAVLLRIVPHLSYLHLFGRRGGPPIALDEVVQPTWARVAAIIVPLGLLVLVAGVLTASPAVARWGAILWAAGAALALAIFARMLALAFFPNLRSTST